MSSTLTVDYVIIGAGAMGMAFADTLVSDSNYTMAIIDRYDSPGGHWNLSYPFVRLHGPSSIYGVNSRPMPSDNAPAGTHLASRHEILDYYDRVMHETLLASDRVSYLPLHEVTGQEAGSTTVQARSLMTGAVTEIVATRRIVDATYMNITVPAMNQRGYEVDPGVSLIPVSELSQLSAGPDRFVVVGAGKTGMDACIWLLNRSVDPDRIRWIVPREAWLVNRATPQAATESSELLMLGALNSAAEVFYALEESGMFMRRNTNEAPESFRCATVDTNELEQLRQIKDTVHLGRVRRVGTTTVELEKGSVSSSPDALYVDCSADGLTWQKPLKPIFEANRITLQPLLSCLLPVSAAVAAKLESADLDDAQRNNLAAPIHNPTRAVDLLNFLAIRADRMLRWSVDPHIGDWFVESRLGRCLPGTEKAKEPEFQSEGANLVTHLTALAKAGA